MVVDLFGQKIAPTYDHNKICNYPQTTGTFPLLQESVNILVNRRTMNSNVISEMGSLVRSKSLCSLSDNVSMDKSGYRANHSRTVSESSAEIVVVSDSDAEERAKMDSGICDKTFDGDLHVLEQKIDRLSDMFQEQCQLLTTMKDEIRSSKAMIEKAEFAHDEIVSELFKKAVCQTQSVVPEGGVENNRAKCLLDAIESRQGSVDSEIRDVLISFLQSEELKERMVQATAESVKDVVGSCLSRDVSALYLPVLEHSHRRLLRHVAKVVEEAFLELEEYSSSLSKSVYKVSRSLQRAIERHRALLEAANDPQKNLTTVLKCTVEELLGKELKLWRQKVLDSFTVLPTSDDFPEPPCLDYASASPPQHTDPERNIIDQLMVSVEITKQIERGEVNAAFERALSAADLSLVMAACRAARGDLFTPRCRLRPHVLLALLQQISTDMLHDTQLKCRYLEDAILHLDPGNPGTRAHLPLVVGEVRKHLSKFLAAYPSHVASRRVSLIIMAADNLLK